jgi:hypothetical protein
VRRTDLVEEITEETAELVARVAALDIGKASLTACVRVPHEMVPGRRRQEVRTFASATRSLLELQDWLVCQGVGLSVSDRQFPGLADRSDATGTAGARSRRARSAAVSPPPSGSSWP